MRKFLLILFLSAVLIAAGYFYEADDVLESWSINSVSVLSSADTVLLAKPATCANTKIWHSDVFVYNTPLEINGYAFGKLYLEGVVDEKANILGEPRNILGDQLIGVGLNLNGESSSWVLNGVRGDIYQFVDIKCVPEWLNNDPMRTPPSSLDALTRLGFFR